MIRYLDTNVYNALADTLAPDEVVRLRPALASAGIDLPFLSPLVIIEIEQTADELRRERLVYVVQHLCADRLLVEPEELLLDYIADSAHLPELERVRPPDVYCRTAHQATWDAVRTNPAMTFVPPPDLRQGMRLFKALFDFIQVQQRHPEARAAVIPMLKGVRDPEEATAALRDLARVVRQFERTTDKREAALHTCWALGVGMLASQLTPFSDRLDPLWEALAVPSPSRAAFVLERMPYLWQAGPMVLLAAWMAFQPADRGNVLDGMHLWYSPYVHEWLTCDAQILDFARGRAGHPTADKILPADAFIDSVVKAVRAG